MVLICSILPYYCLLYVVVQGPESFHGPLNVFVRHTVAELRGIKAAQFSVFGLFSLSEVDALQQVPF